MLTNDIAQRYFSAFIAEAERLKLDTDSACRTLLNLVVAKYLEKRSVDDVRSELQFIAESCDPDTDFMFMRP